VDVSNTLNKGTLFPKELLRHMGKKPKSPEVMAPEAVVVEQVQMPQTPPTEPQPTPPEATDDNPLPLGEAPQANRANDKAEEDKKAKNRFKTAIIAGVAVASTVAVLLMAKGCADDGSSKPKETTTTTIAGEGKGDVCKGGYFDTKDAYAAFRDIMSEELTQAPNETLTDKDRNKSLREFWIGDKNKVGQGVLCENPVASAVVYEAIKQALGQGATTQTDFNPYVENVNTTAEYWAQNNESMKEFLESTQFDSAILNATINKEAIVKSVYKIGTLNVSEAIDGKRIIVQEKVNAELDEGTVFVLEFTQELDDGAKPVTSGQIMYIDLENGVIYLAKGLGNVPDITPTPETTTTSAPANSEQSNGGNGTGGTTGGTTGGNGGGNGGNNGGNGGSGGGNGGGNGGSGGGNGGGNGGSGGGNGGGNGGSGGGNGGGEPKPPTPPTTQPTPPTTQPKGEETPVTTPNGLLPPN
jgi:hypothetical protein